MKKTEIIDLYTNYISVYKDKLTQLEKQLFENSIYRIIVFAILIMSLYYLWGKSLFLIISVFSCIILFIFLVKRQLQLTYQKNLHHQLVEINEKEMNCQNKNFRQYESGIEFKDGEHEYCNDIDLFGKGSFFQYLNRTKLYKSRQQLAEDLKSNNIYDIEIRQSIIQELSPKIEWRQQFSAEAGLVEIEVKPETIIDWIENYNPFIYNNLHYFIYIFSSISIVMFGLYLSEYITEGIITLWLFIGLIISGLFIKKINLLQTHSTKSLQTFNQYHKLLRRIEDETWENEYIKTKINDCTSSVRMSEDIKSFAKLINSLDQRTNIFVSIFANGFFLRDILVSLRIEKWIKNNKKHVRQWFDLISFFDLYNTYGNFAFNHPTFTYPIIESNEVCVLNSKQLGHPLLKDSNRIDNDFKINKESFFIITGANMAGKSTFLRTVALSIVMSNMGLPVCACEQKYKPIKLISSMRTTDSLTDEESYFFSELKRLKYIIDRINDDNYFIILDEILKGTNSVDKAAGSKQFLERLVKSNSTGMIATHDLSLCETAQEYKDVQNFYFDAEIINDELNFDYKFKTGICQNMNASFLLRKMGIVE